MNIARRQLLLFGFFSLLPPHIRAACRVTEPNSLGPFYRRDAPFKTTLAAANEPGQTLLVSGRVLTSDSCTPMANAIVDVWHANDSGRYYDVGADADSSPDQFKLRGRMQTSAQGEYEFETILPGSYGSRPKHIHYVVFHPRSKPLITQLYFEGDSRLTSDFLVRDSLVRPLVENGDDILKTNFDIVLGT